MEILLGGCVVRRGIGGEDNVICSDPLSEGRYEEDPRSQVDILAVPPSY